MIEYCAKCLLFFHELDSIGQTKITFQNARAIPIIYLYFTNIIWNDILLNRFEREREHKSCLYTYDKTCLFNNFSSLRFFFVFKLT